MGWNQDRKKWTVPALTSVRLGMIVLLVIVSTLLLAQLFIETGGCIFIIPLSIGFCSVGISVCLSVHSVLPNYDNKSRWIELKQ